MFKKIAVVLVVALAGLLLFAATRPDTFRVERSASIAAPPDRVYAHIEDLHRWSAWSPWEKKDPAMKRTQSGAASGKGAIYEWAGNKEVGRGRMEITASAPPAGLVIKLDFIEPFEAHNIVEFKLVPEGAGTRVVWSIRGPSPYLSKLMGLVFDMDTMIGRDFEAGLASLKAIAERQGA